MFGCDKIIRFRLKGHKHLRVFDIVAIDKFQRNRGCFYECIGFFSLNVKGHILFVDVNRLGFLLNKGFLLNSSVRRCLFRLVI